jgi:hypothetical protein
MLSVVTLVRDYSFGLLNIGLKALERNKIGREGEASRTFTPNIYKIYLCVPVFLSFVFAPLSGEEKGGEGVTVCIVQPNVSA